MNPIANLPFFLQAIGRGSQGFVQGAQAADEHRRMLQQMGLMQEDLNLKRQAEARSEQEYGMNQQRFQYEKALHDRAMSPASNAIRALLQRLAPQTDVSGMTEGEAERMLPSFARVAETDALAKYRGGMVQNQKDRIAMEQSAKRVDDARKAWEATLNDAKSFENANIAKYQSQDPDVIAEVSRRRALAKRAQIEYQRAKDYHEANFGASAMNFSSPNSGIDLGEPLPDEDYSQEESQ